MSTCLFLSLSLSFSLLVFHYCANSFSISPPPSFTPMARSLYHSILSIEPVSRFIPLSLPPSLSHSLPLFSCLPSLFFSRRQQRQRLGAGHRQAPTRGPGAAAGSDQVHPQGAAVALQGLQKRENLLSAASGWRDIDTVFREVLTV